MEQLINFILLGLLALTALAIERMKDLFAVVMLAGIYSLLSASFFILMDAVDVAFTEAAVGAGISTLLLLTVLTMTGRYERSSQSKSKLALLLVVITGALLIYGTLDMPYFGNASAPAHQHVAPRYVEDSFNEVGVVNYVTAVLASYRAYDTLGEVVVIFTAGIGVLGLLLAVGSRNDDVPAVSMQQHTILRIVTKMFIPLILLFACYVQFHGDYGPGGGFQAGVIFAAAIILYTMIFGLRTANTVIKITTIQWVAAVGVLVYCGVGIASLFAGANFLNYNVLAEDALKGQHLGILLIELGVGITVTAVMIIIFFMFAGRIYRDEKTAERAIP